MYSFLDLLKTDLTSTDNRFRQHRDPDCDCFDHLDPDP
jgi:hypothetical protein